MTMRFPPMISCSRIPFSPVLGLLFAAFLSGCGAEAGRPPTTETSSTETTSEETAPTPVRTAEATARSAPIPIRATGQLAPTATVRLAFKVGGVIQRIRVDEGDRVQKGEVLARLNLAEINAEVQRAESALNKAKRDLSRTRRLYRDSVATLEEKQNAQTAVETARARLQAARFNRTHARIEAPTSGRILRRHAEEGEQIGPGAPVLTVGATAGGWAVNVELPAKDVVRVERGDRARVVFNAHPDTSIEGRVAEIADAATRRSGTYEVELSIEEPGLPLKSGFIGRVMLYPSDARERVEVPAQALASGDGQTGSVFTLDADSQTVRRRSVEIARVIDSMIVLDDGLLAGTPVVTAGVHELNDGDSVRRVEGGQGEGEKVKSGR